MGSNFNVANVGILLAGLLLILSAYYNRPISELVRGILSGNMDVFSPQITGKTSESGFEDTDGSSGNTGGGGGFGSW